MKEKNGIFFFRWNLVAWKKYFIRQRYVAHAKNNQHTQKHTVEQTNDSIRLERHEFDLIKFFFTRSKTQV